MQSSFYLPSSRLEFIHYQEASAFFKKRATIEDEYGRNLHKIARATSETYAMNDGKAGSVLFSLVCHVMPSYPAQFFCLCMAVLHACT